MMEYFRGWPFPLATGVLWVIVVARTGAMYAVARAARSGAGHTRVSRIFDTQAFRRAEQLMSRWGAFAVVAGFLTIGLQTMINLAAGAARMPLRRYVPALSVGGLLWAVLYAAVGGVAVQAWWSLFAAQPVIAVAVLVLVIGALVVGVVRALRGTRPGSSPEADSCSRPVTGSATRCDVPRT